MPAEKIMDACPFCGSYDIGVNGHEVECEDCHATGPCFYPVPDRDAAIAAWNRRADVKVQKITAHNSAMDAIVAELKIIYHLVCEVPVESGRLSIIKNKLDSIIRQQQHQ